MRAVLARTVPQRFKKQNSTGDSERQQPQQQQPQQTERPPQYPKRPPPPVHIVTPPMPTTKQRTHNVTNNMPPPTTRPPKPQPTVVVLPTPRTTTTPTAASPGAASSTAMTITKATPHVPPPSFHRRSSSGSILKKQTPSLDRYMATTPVTKHYELNALVLAAFDSHYSARLYQVAYAMGLQFCETALLEIPKHGYFYSTRHERLRMQSALDACRVAACLLQLQDNYQHIVPHSPPERQRVYRLQQLAVEQVQRASQDQYEQQRLAAEQTLRSQSSINTDSNPEWVLLEPFLSCQESFSSVFCPALHQHHQQDMRASPTTTLVTNDGTRRYTPDMNQNSLLDVPMALAVPLDKQSRSEMHPVARYGQLLPIDQQHHATAHVDDEEDWIHIRPNGADDLLLEKALYLSGLEIVPSTITQDNNNLPVDLQLISPLDVMEVEDDNNKDQKMTTTSLPIVPKVPSIASEATIPQPALSSNRLQLGILSCLYHEDFDSLQHMNRIQILFAPTYQGRLPGSTNGCTVIAPLMCIHHLVEGYDDKLGKSGAPPDNQGLDVQVIQQVIDVETPPILQELRMALGVAEQAFLIPSDVHDYLIQNGQLHTQQFVNVIGGNILDETHLQNLTSALHQSPHKLAATLFFHEHVVAILKIRKSSPSSPKKTTECWYDIIDSLPLKDTIQHVEETNMDFCRRLNLDVTDEYEVLTERYLDRTLILRCKDLEALEATLKWYACSKFTESNIQYIDAYNWDGNDFFDPRVFQAFVWGTPPSSSS